MYKKKLQACLDELQRIVHDLSLNTLLRLPPNFLDRIDQLKMKIFEFSPGPKASFSCLKHFKLLMTQCETTKKYLKSFLNY